MSCHSPRIRYPEPDKQIRTHDTIVEKLASIPGVESVGAVNPLPLGTNSASLTFTVSGAASLPLGNHPGAGYLVVKPEYFKTMKIPILQGRAISNADTKDSPLVVMINEAFAKKHFPDRNPVGQQANFRTSSNKATSAGEIAAQRWSSTIWLESSSRTPSVVSI